MSADLNTKINIEFAIKNADVLKKAMGGSTAEMQKLQSRIATLTGKVRELEGAMKKYEKTATSGAQAAATAVVASEAKIQNSIRQTLALLGEPVKKLKESSKLTKGFGVSGLGLAGAGMAVAGAATGGAIGVLGGATNFATGLASKVAGSIVGFATSGFSNAFQAYLQQGQAMGGLIGLGSRAQFARRGQVGGSKLGYSIAETAQQAGAVGVASGNINAVYQAQQYNRATGMDVGQVAGYMGAVRQAGFGFGGQFYSGNDRIGGKTMSGRAGNAGADELKKVVAAGMAAGIEKSRLGEFVSGTMSMVQQLNAGRAGSVDIGGVASFQSMLSRSGHAGFQGARGAQVSAQLAQAAMNPGGGEAGQAMVLQSLGFGKPGGKTSYYDALKQQQMGGSENIMAMFKEVYSQKGIAGGGGSKDQQQEANLILNKMTGLSLDQIEKLGDILNSDKSAEEKMKEVKKQMEAAVPIDKQALNEMKKGFGSTVEYLAGISDFTAMIGASVAPYMMAAQKTQLNLLKILADLMPDLVDGIQGVYLTVRLQYEKMFNDSWLGGKTLQESEQDYKNQERIINNVVGTNPKTLRGKILRGEHLAAAAKDRVAGAEQEVIDITEHNQPLFAENARWMGQWKSNVDKFGQKGGMDFAQLFVKTTNDRENANHKLLTVAKSNVEEGRKVLAQVEKQLAADRKSAEQIGDKGAGATILEKLGEGVEVAKDGLKLSTKIAREERLHREQLRREDAAKTGKHNKKFKKKGTHEGDQ
jgi:hypothetical protein